MVSCASLCHAWHVSDCSPRVVNLSREWVCVWSLYQHASTHDHYAFPWLAGHWAIIWCVCVLCLCVCTCVRLHQQVGPDKLQAYIEGLDMDTTYR